MADPSYDDFLEARRVDAYERCSACWKLEEKCLCDKHNPKEEPEYYEDR